ncbi:MAG: PAS domain-containing protein [Planctomycetota bacterium]
MSDTEPSFDPRYEGGTAFGNERVPAELLREAAGAIDSMIVIADMTAEDNPLIFVNDYFQTFTGYSHEEILGKNCRFLQYDADGNRDPQPEATAAIRDAIENGRPARVQIRNYRKSGEMFWNELFLSPVFDGEQNLVHFVGVQNNITERVLAREALRRSEDTLAGVFETGEAPTAIVSRDEQGKIVHRFTNRAVASYFGLDRDTAVGLTLDELGLEDEAVARFDGAFEPEQSWNSPPTPVIFRIGGDRRVVHIRVTPLGASPVGEPRFCYVIEDITEKERVRSERLLLGMAVENCDDAILITDAKLDAPDGPTILYANPAFERMSGYSRDELVGNTPRIVQGPNTDRFVLDELKETLREGRTFHGETINYRKDGTEYIVEWRIKPVRIGDDRIRYYVASQRDLTRRRAVERRILSVQTAEQRRIGRNLHDGPMQQLVGLRYRCESLSNDLADGSPEAAAKAAEAAELATAVSQELRTLSHILTPPALEGMPLSAGLERLTGQMTDIYNVQIVASGDGDLDDPDVATQVYLIAREAIGNALRHGKARRVEAKLIQQSPSSLVLEISDEGTGFDPADAAGGIGLQTMDYRARSFGGSLEIDSSPGGGSVVRCYVPVSPVATNGQPSPAG